MKAKTKRPTRKRIAFLEGKVRRLQGQIAALEHDLENPWRRANEWHQIAQWMQMRIKEIHHLAAQGVPAAPDKPPKAISDVLSVTSDILTRMDVHWVQNVQELDRPDEATQAPPVGEAPSVEETPVR